MSANIKWLTPNSLRGRYILVVIVLFIFLVGIATFGWYTVQRGAHDHNYHMKVLGGLERSIDNYILKYQEVKYTTLEFMIQPDELNHMLYMNSIDVLSEGFLRLEEAKKNQQNSVFNEHFKRLKMASDHLHLELEKIINVRQDANKTFPFTPMLLKIARGNEEVLSLIDRVMSSEPLPEHLKVIFDNTRYAWLRLMADFRLLLSVRFSVFTGDWQQAYNQRNYNINLLEDSIVQNINLLITLKGKEELPFIVDNEAQLLQDLATESLEHYHDAIDLISAPNWRQDLVLLRDNLRPAFSELDESIKVLHQKEEQVWTVSMSELSAISQRLSDSLWVLLILCSLLSVLGYIMFSKAILTPIRNIAQALNSEAHGLSAELEGYSSAIEIRDLMDAFQEMRKQVNSRQQRLLNILDNAAEAIITIDSEGLIETFNTAAEQLFGYCAVEVLGRDVFKLVPEEVRDSYYALYLNHHHSEEVSQELANGYGYEFDILCKSRATIPVSVKFSKTIIDECVFYTGLVVDISERRASEYERQQHLSEMAHVGRLSIMGEMAAGIAHELNQPLAAMSLYLQGSLRRDNSNLDACKDIIRAVKSAIGQVDRASAIIRKMRGFARRESFHLELADMNELIRKSVEFVLVSQQCTSPQAKLFLSEQEIMVRVDVLQIEQVLVNLIRNALDAQSNLEESKRVLQIKCDMDNKGVVRVYVIDAGEGVAKENVDKIFNTYFTTKADGLGMGLSICRSIIEEHDGVLWYNDSIEYGSEFCFLLPKADI
ncbi:hypothetical protein MNBD_GAMMA07-987 [hydrothermal vent metagenome]|uniref:histidine kinase n=1 Tax=hydrothermal vent metagenome TaxID=652676 RepID=A0A3B0WTY7_9ZZZZ